MSRPLLQKIWRLPRLAVKRFVTTLLRVLLLMNRPARLARSGFVLPTTALLVLMVLLTATALTYRAFTRSDQSMTQREQQVIANAATPAIDRAKAKIEFIFQTDPRFPSGVPSSDVLANLMLPQVARIPDAGVAELPGAGADPYTLPDETRLDINNDGIVDNAWSFPSDVDGDGEIDEDDQGNFTEIVAYSILVDDQGPRENSVIQLQDSINNAKADALVTRTGPLATTEATPGCSGARAESGWQVVETANNSSLQKNFQINAFVANKNNVNRSFESYEFQQSRIANRANKWGAWFRYDLAIYPGPEFNWNGAMHTDGNLMVHNNLRSHMVSSHNSCVYSQVASEITMGEFPARDTDGDGVVDTQPFQGQAIKAAMKFDNYTTEVDDRPRFHVWDTSDNDPPLFADNDGVRLTVDNDSVTNSGRPSDVSMNPLTLFTTDIEEHIDRISGWARQADWNEEDSLFVERGRIKNDPVSRPYVDDFYRADDRWGPKPRYDSQNPNLDITAAAAAAEEDDPLADLRIGDDIDQNAYSILTNEETGLDGYWERRAIKSGLRLIVGQRLELGNPDGWGYDPRTDSQVTNGDRLYPANSLPAAGGSATGTNNLGALGGLGEHLQRKSLTDNLAAVQGMAVYHYDFNSGQFPAACMASTSHFGTYQSIIDSRTFGSYANTGALKTDFLNGQGTNGWEFQFPAAFDTEEKFAGQLDVGDPLGNALRNLAYFAGDPDGGAPSFRAVQDTAAATAVSHPYPYQAMWGDFSGLRRIFDDYLDNGVTYDELSFADQSTLHTAACTLGMLAYNLDAENEELLAFLETEDLGITTLSTITTNLRTTLLQIVNYMEDGSVATSPAGITTDAMFTSLGKTTTWNDPNVDTDTCPSDTAGFEKDCDVGEYFSEYTQENWRIVLAEGAGAATTDVDTIFAFADTVHGLSASIRDRDLGFRSGAPINSLAPETAPSNAVAWGTTEPLYTEAISLDTESHPLKVSCNPNLFGEVVNNVSGDKNDLAAFALIVCSNPGTFQVKYPALYYLFPLNEHDHDGGDYHQQPDGNDSGLGGGLDTAVQAGEDYVTAAYLETANASVTYRVVGSDAVEGVADIAAVPKPADDLEEWVIPVDTTTRTGALTTAMLQNSPTASTNPGEPFAIQIGSSSRVDVPFLDKVLMNGREQLPIRVLDIDINKLTETKTSSTGDHWLPAKFDDDDNPAEGVVYAFREDAVREDEIVRAKNSSSTVTADYCQERLTTNYPRLFRIEITNTCYSDYRILTSNPFGQDPPLTDRGISLKPVDFTPDPARRPYGFRLRTADGVPADFSGVTDLSSADARQVGMTLVTNDALYVMGNFNPHSSDGTVTAASILEEFDQTLLNGDVGYGGPFYNDREDLNTTTFANFDEDHWRPVELLSDSLNLLAVNYIDGSLADAFTAITLDQDPGGQQTSSFPSLNRPEFTNTADNPQQPTYVLTNPTATSPQGSPVWFDRNGVFYVTRWYDSDGNELTSATPAPFFNAFKAEEERWTRMGDDRERRYNLQTATQTYTNATFVSGIVPHRPRQGYGGLHNYPRFLQRWENINLFIQGSFIQLNFSTAATAPFEQDTWEPGSAPTTSEPISYYQPPNRRWGFDVGLLYVPPAPAAKRFVSVTAPRSEYFREVPADDPYITNLRCAEDLSKDGDDKRIFPNFCPS